MAQATRGACRPFLHGPREDQAPPSPPCARPRGGHGPRARAGERRTCGRRRRGTRPHCRRGRLRPGTVPDRRPREPDAPGDLQVVGRGCQRRLGQGRDQLRRQDEGLDARLRARRRREGSLQTGHARDPQVLRACGDPGLRAGPGDRCLDHVPGPGTLADVLPVGEHRGETRVDAPQRRRALRPGQAGNDGDRTPRADPRAGHEGRRQAARQPAHARRRHLRHARQLRRPDARDAPRPSLQQLCRGERRRSVDADASFPGRVLPVQGREPRVLGRAVRAGSVRRDRAAET